MRKIKSTSILLTTSQKKSITFYKLVSLGSRNIFLVSRSKESGKIPGMLLKLIFHQHKIVRPSYTTLQEVVSQALNKEKNRLSNKIYTLIDKPFRELLANFLEKDDLFYQLTTIKKDQKDFTTAEINASVKNHQFLSAIYQRSIEVIKELGISEQNIMHYAELAVYITCYGLRAMKQKNLSRLYLMCYAHQRYLKISDHLVASCVHKINYFMGKAEEHQAQAICDAKDDDKDQRHAAAAILSLVNNKKVADYEIRGFFAGRCQSANPIL